MPRNGIPGVGRRRRIFVFVDVGVIGFFRRIRQRR
jgi:hypothetical protein